MIEMTKTLNAEHVIYTLTAYEDNEVIYNESVEVTKDTTLDEAAIKKILVMTLLHDNYQIVVDELVDTIQVEHG